MKKTIPLVLGLPFALALTPGRSIAGSPPPAVSTTTAKPAPKPPPTARETQLALLRMKQASEQSSLRTKFMADLMSIPSFTAKSPANQARKAAIEDKYKKDLPAMQARQKADYDALDAKLKAQEAAKRK